PQMPVPRCALIRRDERYSSGASAMTSANGTMARNMSRIEVTDLVVKVLEPLKTEDESHDIALPVTFRVRGELQRLKIIIPNNNKVKNPSTP
ncbi:hypothetical protein BGZ82_002119, partial [Podila clonocystis]